MDEKTQTAFALAAVFLLLFSAMIDPLISFAMASALIIFFLYNLARQGSKKKPARKSRKAKKKSRRRK